MGASLVSARRRRLETPLDSFDSCSTHSCRNHLTACSFGRFKSLKHIFIANVN